MIALFYQDYLFCFANRNVNTCSDLVKISTEVSSHLQLYHDNRLGRRPRPSSVIMNSFLLYNTLLSHNYVIKIFAGYASYLNYLYSGEFHVGKKPRHGGEECWKLAVFAQYIPGKFIILQCCTMFLEGRIFSHLSCVQCGGITVVKESLTWLERSQGWTQFARAARCARTRVFCRLDEFT